jgi:hypothetical protein
MASNREVRCATMQRISSLLIIASTPSQRKRQNRDRPNPDLPRVYDNPSTHPAQSLFHKESSDRSGTRGATRRDHARECVVRTGPQVLQPRASARSVRRAHRTDVRGWRASPRPNHGLTTVVTTRVTWFSGQGQPFGTDSRRRSCAPIPSRSVLDHIELALVEVHKSHAQRASMISVIWHKRQTFTNFYATGTERSQTVSSGGVMRRS